MKKFKFYNEVIIDAEDREHAEARFSHLLNFAADALAEFDETSEIFEDGQDVITEKKLGDNVKDSAKGITRSIEEPARKRKPVKEVVTKNLEIGAGAKIDQQVFDDTE